MARKLFARQPFVTLPALVHVTVGAEGGEEGVCDHLSIRARGDQEVGERRVGELADWRRGVAAEPHVLRDCAGALIPRDHHVCGAVAALLVKRVRDFEGDDRTE